MTHIQIHTDYIKLDQFLKLADVVSSGGEAKEFIRFNPILVNSVIEERRGRKLRDGDIVLCPKGTFLVVQER